jgi:ribosomal protein S18 acetylase RimI-like enzyme
LHRALWDLPIAQLDDRIFALPAGLARGGVTVRVAGPDDPAFFRTLFATTRSDAATLAQWPERERTAFLDSQFRFQDMHYRQAYDGADFLVIACENKPVGRLILDRRGRDWWIVDIGLLPDERGRGLGSAILRGVQAAAVQAAAAKLSLHVEHGNRALALYKRLGFAETGDTGSHIAMVWAIS